MWRSFFVKELRLQPKKTQRGTVHCLIAIRMLKTNSKSIKVEKILEKCEFFLKNMKNLYGRYPLILNPIDLNSDMELNSFVKINWAKFQDDLIIPTFYFGRASFNKFPCTLKMIETHFVP